MTTTQLTDLISKCQDVEEKAETWTDKNKGFFATNASNRYEGFLAGAAYQSPIADALREAMNGIASLACECCLGQDGHREPCVKCIVESTVRQILEGKE